ncbi:MAG: glycosyltransferase family 2 protein [Candidatus Aenigmatarchaeota archaeon]|nr:MAG: glycosyltransferase family 2 protein [Candidatus Aenigmarchaeota archaeon]
MPDSFAIIPTLNEERTIAQVIRKTLKHVDTLIIVDSSNDNTPQICRSFKKGLILLTAEKLGKGHAVRKGIREAMKFDPKNLVFLDGDGEKDAGCIPKLLESLENHDFVIGRRNRMRSRTRLLLNKFSNLWVRIVTDYRVTDTNSGFFALKTDCIRKFRLRSIGFEIEMEMVLEAFRNNLTLTEVPVEVPEISESKLSLKHMIEMIRFFDEWVLENIRIQKSLSKKIFLSVFCILGITFSGLFRLLTLKNYK